MLGVRLPEDLEKRLCSLAKKTQRPKSFYVKEALAHYLNEYEPIYEAVAEYESEKKKGTFVTYSLDEIMERHGLTHADLDAEVFD